MTTTSPFAIAEHYRPLETVEYRGVSLPARFRDSAEEYETVSAHAGVFDRSERGLVFVTGEERKPWLHNLVTNAVKTLREDAGTYAFAVNVKGRVQFDTNILNLPEALWLDIDVQAIPGAVAHLDRYLVTEDARLTDASPQYARLGCAGPAAREIARSLGTDKFEALSVLGSIELSKEPVRLVRNEFAGLPGFELVVPRHTAARWWDRIVGDLNVRPAGFHVLDALRTEAGIPWLGADIDQTVLPPETGQTERGISYQKGCYLGQEVLERMRARGALSRRLVHLCTADGAGLALPATLRQANADVGRLTSLVKHPRDARWIGLGYLKANVADSANLTVGDPARAIHVELS